MSESDLLEYAEEDVYAAAKKAPDGPQTLRGIRSLDRFREYRMLQMEAEMDGLQITT